MTAESFQWVSPHWPAPRWVRAFTTERGARAPERPYDGINLAEHVEDEPDRVSQYRADLMADLSLPEQPVWLDQVHGTTVINIDSGPSAHSADGAFTTKKGIVAAVLTADCAPIFLTDRSGQFVGLLHGGWRGVAGGIVEQGVKAVPASPGDLLAWVGPTIGPNYFEIGEEVKRQLVQDPTDEKYFAPSKDRFLADLPGLIVSRLRRAGVGFVAASNLCTYSDARRWFSYRRQGTCGRMASLIWLAP